VLKRHDAAGTTTTVIASEEDWYGVLADVFGLDPAAIPPADRHRLWEKVHAQHRRWEESRADG
jgi:hypothetical protein